MVALSAYLNGTLKETVFIQQPEMFADVSGSVCKLQKSIYGVKQSFIMSSDTICKGEAGEQTNKRYGEGVISAWYKNQQRQKVY